MTDTIDLSKTIEPNSQQMNADDLISGPKTIKIRRVTASSGSKEQPISVFYEGDDGKPYMPCKSMRRVMVQLWGANAGEYTGKRMTLYRDPKVTWGGMEVGGIRISHMSDIEAPTMRLVLTESKTKRGAFTVHRLEPEKETKKPAGDIAQARVALEGADAITVDVLLEGLRAWSWTKEEGAEIKKLSDAARKRKQESTP